MSGYISDEEAVPTSDPSSSTGLLLERTQAWKHMCGYLEDYVSELAKDQKSQAKEQEKVLKTISRPLKEGNHFDQTTGGIASMFENLRANTQAQANLFVENSTNLSGTVLPMLSRLHAEIKNKHKELSHGAGKNSKTIEASRNSSQKHIELLGQHAAHFDSAGGKVTAANDPYVLQRGIYHKLNKQLMEENTNRQDMLKVQDQFAEFEAHVVTTFQAALKSLQQFMSGHFDRQKAMFGDIAATASNIPPTFEWAGFAQRNGHILVSPNTPNRTMEHTSFPNQNHRATKALVEGTLERKHRGLGALGGYTSNYYAVTPSGYLHQYKDNDNYSKDPIPEVSLYLPDCVVGAIDGTKFIVKGKDASGGKLGQKMAMSSDFTFRAQTNADAAQWHNVIAGVSGGSTGSVPNSPIEERKNFQAFPAPAATGAGATGGMAAQQEGIAARDTVPMGAGSGMAPASTSLPATTHAGAPTTATAAPTGSPTTGAPGAQQTFVHR